MQHFNEMNGDSKKSNLSDEQIVSMILRVNSAVMFEMLYYRYAKKVFKKCLSYVKNEHIAQDLTHDIFLKAYNKLSTFENKSKFSTWLYSITYNYCMDYLRKNQKRVTTNLDTDTKTMQNLADNVEEKNENEVSVENLLSIIENLNNEDQVILKLKYIKGKSIKEIQKILKISESAVKMRIKRAKERTRKFYKKKYPVIK